LCGRKSGGDEEEGSRNQKKEHSAPGLSQENLREQRGYPEGAVGDNRGTFQFERDEAGKSGGAGEKRKCLTWRTKSEIITTSFEVGYVPSSLPDH
jgi:hypothetical protein